MTRRKRGWILRGALGGSGLLAAVGALALGMLTEPASSVPGLFLAPTSVPEGESWVLIGSKEGLPRDLEVVARSGDVTVLETRRLSDGALGVRISVGAQASGDLLTVRSASLGLEVTPAVVLAGPMSPLERDANLEPDDREGPIVLPGEYFVYAYLEDPQAQLSALRIHNRSTGAWCAHEIALERALAALEEPVAVDPAFFADVDPHVTLPDSDGDGIYDFDEEPETRDPLPRQIAVRLSPGENILDLVASDALGRSSWSTLTVFTTWVEPAEGGGL